MNGEPATASKLTTSDDSNAPPKSPKHSHNVGSEEKNRASPIASSAPIDNENRRLEVNGACVNDKSDSEAETEVLSGKEEDDQQKIKKTIKLEEASAPEYNSGFEAFDLRQKNDNAYLDEKPHNGHRRQSLKRKRGVHDPQQPNPVNGNVSSNLSSTIPSSAPEARSFKEVDCMSDPSRLSPAKDEIAGRQQGPSNEERAGQNTVQGQSKGQRDGTSDTLDSREYRETRSATHLDGSAPRSESPPPRSTHRAQSIQASLSHAHGITKRRKAPAPLRVERRRKTSEDTHAYSDDSESVHSHYRFQEKNSFDGNAMSLAKPPHKKTRDRNGRTLLARAATTDRSEAEARLRERPQDLDLSDNAGNTPLQIASLGGDAEIVQLLLDAGCDIHCKNIDMDTPLIDAVENGHLEVVRILLKAGLDPRQRNAKGQEPLELVKPDDEEYEEIRAALLESKKEKDTLRRQSEDINRQQSIGSKDVEMPQSAALDVSPTNSTRSPPPMVLGARRRTARSQPTDDALLWVNATPKRLRDAAGKGDLTIVDHILKMRPEADTESVLAAARGGHEVVLGLILAIAEPEADPEPLRLGDYKLGYSTPMLAAIGHGNAAVIKLLLDQPGFDPTRRLYKDLTYYEIAKERQSLQWQDEYNILKAAHDNYKKHGGRKSNKSSPLKVRTKRPEEPAIEPSSSPHEARRVRKHSLSAVEESIGEMKREGSHKAAAHRQRREGKELSVIQSDRELDSLGVPKPKSKEGRSTSDAGSTVSGRAESLKPKRKLMTGNERRASLAAEASAVSREGSIRISGDSVSSHEHFHRDSTDAHPLVVKTKKAASEEPSAVKTDVQNEPGKKRLRISVSPQANRSEMSDSVKRKKRQRVDSQGTAIDQDRDHPRVGPGMVANMMSSSGPVTSPSARQGTAPVTSPSAPQGTAPVAFMGSSAASPVTRSPIDGQVRSTVISPVNTIDQTLQQDSPRRKEPDEDILRQRAQEQAERLEHERLEQEILEQERLEQDQLSRTEADERQKAEDEVERQAQAAREEAELKARIAHEQEQARLEAERQADEEERRIQTEREEEEARRERKRKEEDLQRRRTEQERARKEDQERRRREAEERESLRRMRLQEEEERIRREALPNGLRRAAELRQDDTRHTKEITKWLPLRTVTTQDMDPDCVEQMAEERWIANIQAAPILAIKDLELSQYTAWTRLPTTPSQLGSLWRQLRNPMSQAIPSAFINPTQAFILDNETRPKFLALKVFWIKLSDFLDIVPRHPHLSGLTFSTRDFVLHEFPFGRPTAEGPLQVGGGERESAFNYEERESPIMNGNRGLTNGYR